MRRIAAMSLACALLLLPAGPNLSAASALARVPDGLTVGDLVKERTDSRAAQTAAQSARDLAAQALADADSALGSATDRVGKADTTLAKGLGKVGPVIIDGVVYEPMSDGSIRIFTPLSADTPVDLGDPVPTPGPAPTDPNPTPPPAPAAARGPIRKAALARPTPATREREILNYLNGVPARPAS